MLSYYSAADLAKSIDVLEALYFIQSSWDKVESAAIKNCFRKAGFSESIDDLPDFDAEDDIPLATYANLVELFPQSNGFDEFLKVDEIVLTEDDCIETLYPSAVMEINESEDSEDEVHVEIPDPINSYDEALKQIVRLKHFAKDDFVAFQQIKNIESHFETQQLKLSRSKLKQSNLNQFFRPQ